MGQRVKATEVLLSTVAFLQVAAAEVNIPGLVKELWAAPVQNSRSMLGTLAAPRRS